MAHVYAEGVYVPGVDAATIVGALMREHGYPSVRIRLLARTGVVQVWFDADTEDIGRRLREFSVRGFSFDYLDVY